MTKVTYFLGAGFSAPLGLPLTSNFLEISKDIYFSDTKRYAHFKRVFDTIKAMSYAKNFYNSNLLNIEEILSILEMRESLTGESDKWFLQYIIDVITASTPDILPANELPENWYRGAIFGPSEEQQRFGAFVACLLNLSFKSNRKSNQIAPQFKVHCRKFESPITYSVVTPNYDLVLEKYAIFFTETYSSKSYFGFTRASKKDEDSPRIAKLHGSVDTGDIVPPTWNKSLHNSIVAEWKLAFKLLSEAEHIRIIGYSLPDMDAYVRYLFKAAVLDSENLKSFDVICLDADGSVKKRYDDFIRFPKYRFANGSVWGYLDRLLNVMSNSVKTTEHFNELPIDGIERIHDNYMGSREG